MGTALGEKEKVKVSKDEIHSFSYRTNFLSVSFFSRTAENDYFHPSDFALYQDRLLMFYDLPQVYGSQIIHSESIELYRVWNAENINERRREVHMPPIEEYLHNFGLNFEEEKQRMHSSKK